MKVITVCSNPPRLATPEQPDRVRPALRPRGRYSDAGSATANVATGPAPDDRAPVAGYRLLRHIGEGGMSTVYLSYDVAGRRPVAVKLLADHLAASPEFVNRFYREARLSRVLEHANIVQGYAAGFDPDASKHYLVLEFIDGPTAHAASPRLGRLPVGVACGSGSTSPAPSTSSTTASTSTAT